MMEDSLGWIKREVDMGKEKVERLEGYLYERTKYKYGKQKESGR